MQTMPRPAASRSAYTLIELLTVIVLMGVMAAIMLPRFEPSTYEQLHGAVQIVASDLTYARNLAVTNDSQYQLSFSRSTNSYTLEHSGSNSLLEVLPFTPYRRNDDTPDTHTTFLDDLPHLGPGVQFVGLRVGTGILDSSGVIEFDSLGGLTSTQPITIWLACGSDASRRYLGITVAPATGLTSVGEFTATAP